MWTYNETTQTLNMTEYPFYEIDLARCNSSSEILDWIIQVSRKTWATTATVGSLVKAFDDLFDLQANVCSWGRNKPFHAIN